MAVQRQMWVLGFIILAVNAACMAQAEPVSNPSTPVAASPKAPADLNSILSQMEAAQAANPARSEAYVLVRQYRFYQGSEPADAKSEVVAQVSFTPPDVKTFDILETRGSGRGTSVVKHILESEAEVSKDVSRNEISRKNYEFSLIGTAAIDGRPAFVLSLAPRRDDHLLLRGRVFVDAENFRILRAEGQPARSPSWWLRSSYVIMRYGEAEGLWLPIATEGTAEVRVFGHFVLNSEKVSLQVGNQVASARLHADAAHSTQTAAEAAHTGAATRAAAHHPRIPVAVGAGVIPNP
ncbi:MAG TPA: hypothetical protein VE998_12365 [Terriglobales bacterium]|nr:hypothetical protein [Terriglobales bacterium]